MNFKDRKEKYAKKNKPESIKLNFDITMMNAFCSYIISENASIHRSSVSALRSLFNKMDEDIFENNQECILRYKFCLAALSAKLDKKLSNRDLILRDVYGIVSNKLAELDSNNFKELSNNEVDWVEGQISTSMDMLFINNNAYEMQTACANFLNCDYTEKGYYANELKDKAIIMNGQFRKNDLDRSSEDDIFTLSKAMPTIVRVQERLNRQSYKLITGMQGLNDILAGGFSGSKVYCYFALPGEGKTITLLNLLYQIKKWNKNYVCRDKTKRPCLVLLTMENKVYESFPTLFNIACSDINIEDYTPEEAMQYMIANELVVDENNPIEIKMFYKPINSVTTEYLYKLVDDLEDDGYEVIGLIQDYIKRIKPVENAQDERFKLGAIINEFRNFATYKDIPVITASQLNREAARIIDDSRNSNKNDLVKKLGRANIGESSLIDENLDATLFLTPEWVGEQKYMGFKLTKSRFPIYTKVTSFYQPFAENSNVKLVEDVGLIKPLYEKSLASNSEDAIRKNFGDTIKFSNNREIKDITELQNDIFNGGTSYRGATFSPRMGLITVVDRVPVNATA